MEGGKGNDSIGCHNNLGHKALLGFMGECYISHQATKFGKDLNQSHLHAPQVQEEREREREWRKLQERNGEPEASGMCLMTYLLPVVKSKPHEPDFTLLVVKLVDDGDIGVIVLQLSLVEQARFPTHNGVLTTLCKQNYEQRNKPQNHSSMYL